MDMSKMEALESVVTEVDGESPQAQAEQQQAATEQQALEDGAREWGMIAYTVGAALSMLAPELKDVYTEDNCLGWGRAVVPVAEKYGWNGPGNVPEIGLVLATASLGVPSFLVIRAKLKVLREERELQEARERAERNKGAATFENVVQPGPENGG